ncbi:hypothetical protein [Cellulomonas oligotrophica]|uniref:Uncharacterized protein n=1 Tax=Cellulomonas oligotrophica TaxID=931536 RepID=A0A7Y9FJ36_9CELL|nr:hypothetical protein [Cellulomonas oligotrophica]NYD88078.1 hypothetical protein [Cellulomonas oligotrophica]GIG33585.1 hypothetical protein Col01nite_27440 [Cellulomonas oligotrophica]
MAGLAEFATDQIEFDRLAQSVGVVVELGARLPAWPFRPQRAFSHVIEYDRVLGGDFAAVLLALARTYNDHAVATVVLDPDVGYYSDAYGILPGFQVETASLEAGYVEGLRLEPGGDATGALAYTADVIAIAGSSGKWALLGQRDWEIALLCTPQDSGPWSRTPVPVFGRDLDLGSIRSPAGWGVELAEDEVREFWENVRSQGSGR